MFTDRRQTDRQTDIMITIPLVLPRGKNDNLPKESTIKFDKKDGGVEDIFYNTYDDEFVFYGFSNHEL